ncbi:MAG TPA: hypothetical protein PK360_21265 [bacterium]|nr:hypothetical protein [bacterium]
MFVIGSGLIRGEAWAFWGLLFTLALTLAGGFAAGALVGYKTEGVNVAYAIVILAGLALAAAGIFFGAPLS